MEAIEAVVPEAQQVQPETVLWAAVIEQIFIDAFEASDSMLADFKTWRLKSDSDFDPEAIRAEARRWLVSDLSPWKDDREDACDLANFDPDSVRLLARGRLDAARAEEEQAKNEGREPRRCRYNVRHRKYDVLYEERSEDRLRLIELVDMDEEHRALQLRREAKERGERMRAKNARDRENQTPEEYLEQLLAEAAEKRERKLAYNRRWYAENKAKKRAEATAG